LFSPFVSFGKIRKTENINGYELVSREKIMRTTVFLLAFLFLFPVVHAHGEGVAVHAGLQTVSFGADLGKYYDFPAGPGVAVILGLPSFLGVPFDICAGLRNTKEGNSGDDAEFNWVEIGPRFPFGKENSRIRPEWFAGAGLYDLKIGDLDFDPATGAFFGFGLEDFASEKISGRFQIKMAYWKSDTGSLDASSLSFTLMYGYHF